MQCGGMAALIRFPDYFFAVLPALPEPSPVTALVASTLSFLGFLASLLLRICPFAMA
jgi:hypothetical protein